MQQALRQGTGARFAMVSDTGQVRTHNEDACAADEAAGLWVVCDGMGGAAAGEVASQLAARVFLETARQLALDGIAERRLEAAAKAANAAVFAESRRLPQLHGMGTTLVAMAWDPAAKTVWVVHVGDSRCYRFRAGRLEALTEDHSFVDEQVRLGLMTRSEGLQSPLRHVITRAVGSQAEVEAAVSRYTAVAGDVYLLCSDGVTGELDDEDMQRVLTAAGDNLDHGARMLVDMANARGGKDNLTVVLVGV